MRKAHLLNGLLLLLLGTAALQAYSRLSANAPAEAPPPLISARVGHPVAALVRLSDSTRAQLSQVSSGSCRLVVVYSPDCGASLDQARRWAQDAAADPRRLVPQGWQAIWVAGIPTDSTGTRLPHTLPVQVATVDSAGPLLKELGLRAYPRTLLDREGRIKAAGIGATLPRSKRCARTAPSTRPSPPIPPIHRSACYQSWLEPLH